MVRTTHLSDEIKDISARIVAKLFFIILDYIKFGPLIFVSLYYMLLVTGLFLQDGHDPFVYRFLSFFLGGKEEISSFNQDDIKIIISRIWFIFGTIFELIKKVFKFEIKGISAFISTALVFLVISIIGAIKIKVGPWSVLLVFYILSIINLGLYFLLSRGVNYLKRVEEKRQEEYMKMMNKR